MGNGNEVYFCKDCYYWDAIGSPEEADWGLCRRQTPSVYRVNEDLFKGRWPETLHDDWCGETRSMVAR